MTLAVATACTDSTGPDSFLGLWRGSNAVFQTFQLNFHAEAQGGDTVWGAALFIFAQPAGTVADTDFVALTQGDSLGFIVPGPPSAGGILVSFAGERSASRIYGLANGVPITLRRE